LKEEENSVSIFKLPHPTN